VPPATVGAQVTAVETPALLVKLDVLEGNIKNLTASLGAIAPSVAIRSHFTSHKTVEIAALQMKQERHIGVSCQKVSEAVAVADAGEVRDIVLTNVVAVLSKARRLASLVRRGCTVTSVLDSQESLDVLAAAARAEGVRMGIIIDVDAGHGRCANASAEVAVRLARAVADVEALQLRGIQVCERTPSVQHIEDWSQRKAAAMTIAEHAKVVVESLEAHGFPCEVVTGSGTGTCAFDAASGVFTEVQAGSYVFNDASYAKNLDATGMPVSMWRQSLFVASTVISRNEDARRVVLDAGQKAISCGSVPPVAVGPWEVEEAPTVEIGDEHMVLHFKPGDRIPVIGDQVLLVPGNCDLTVNLHDHILGIRDDIVEEVWPVAARGPGF